MTIASSVSTLSSYSYIFLLLHFLMSVIKKPIISNLQSQLDNCYSHDCNYYAERNIVGTIYDNKIKEVNIRFHTCVRIINKQTNTYSNDEGSYEACTIWNSENVDSMGVLFINFMEYCSKSKNYRDVSIVNGGQDYAGFKESEVNKADAWIQDPFVLQKNIA